MNAQDEARWAHELVSLHRRIAAAEAALRDEVKERKGAIAKMQKRVGELLDLLEGRTGVQIEIPDQTAKVLDEARKGGGR